jgi:hypothetical protein
LLLMRQSCVSKWPPIFRNISSISSAVILDFCTMSVLLWLYDKQNSGIPPVFQCATFLVGKDWVRIREKRRGAIDLSTGSYISLGLLGRGCRGHRNSSGEGRQSGEGGWAMGMSYQPSASWAKNTIMTECAQESGHLQSMYYLVCGGQDICDSLIIWTR